MEASLRILREMALKDGANLQYVGYLVKIANMGQRFQWKSVIKYDAEYRKAQAEAGFPFGADSSFMMQLFLRDRPAADAKPSPQSNSSSRPQTLFDPLSGKPVCGRFNTPAGCKLPHCKFAHEQPKIISALSAIPKPDGGVRLIHDLSRPADQSVNSYASKDYCKYESISDAIALIQPGWFMAVVDLKSAYRSVHISPDEQCITGLQWQFSGQKQPLTMCDTRLPFGARKSPAIFNRITQAVARSLRQAGHHVVVYLDDFFVCGPDFVSCKATYDALILKLRNLGFQISWNKVVDPCQQLVFLGIQIDTMTGHLSLKPEKLSELCGLIHTFRQRKRASRSQLESLAGKNCAGPATSCLGVAPTSDPYMCWFHPSSHQPTSAALVTYRRIWPGGIIGSTMGKTGDIFGPQPLPLMYLPMPVPMLAEPSAAVTCFMHTGPMMFHG